MDKLKVSCYRIGNRLVPASTSHASSPTCHARVALAVGILLALAGLCTAASSGIVVGAIDATGRAILDQERLVKQFADGGPITSLGVIQEGGNTWLVRLGKSAANACRTEYIPLHVSGKVVQLWPNLEGHAVACTSFSCGSVCYFDLLKNQCQCTSGGQCTSSTFLWEDAPIVEWEGR